MQRKAQKSMKCQICGQEEVLPFQCPYCGDQFCTIHRLPENHECSKMDLARGAKRDTMTFNKPNTFEYKINYGKPRQSKSSIYFSYKELKHLALGSLLVIGVGLSIGFGQEIFFMVGLAIILTTSFFIHEIAHKIIAQKSGLWAEFRLTLWGSMLTAVFIVLPVTIKIISPGAVMISGPAKHQDIGKISIAGPLTNIILASIFLGLIFLPTQFSWIFAIGAFFNSIIALFNLIPIGILDGVKIFYWNKIIWLVAFSISAVLLIISYPFI
jgi:Zn-dependent protease